MGAFATWQPIYEEAGIATFPVDAVRKAPSVGNYLRAGLPASRQWAGKFADADGIGFACGKRNKLTVLDIDTRDENTLADALQKFGPSPVVIRTASQKFHVWYRHHGERRLIRPDKQTPIDILGGGYAVAPPSGTSAGKYEFIQGSLADLASLPFMRSAPADILLEAPAGSLVGQLAGEGERNNTLWREAMKAARDAATIEALLSAVQDVNRNAISPPLPDGEVMRVAASAWEAQQDGRNWIGSGKRIVKTFEEIDAFAPKDGTPDKAAPDALFLLDLLRRLHFGRQSFFVANAMHERLGWSRKRFTTARLYLVRIGKLRVLKHPAKDAPAIYGF